MVKALDIALTGLNAQSNKLSATASNVANIRTSGSLEEGKQAPYTPLTTQQTTQTDGSVRSSIVDRANPFAQGYDPDSPLADENGIIGIPNIDINEEMTNLAKAQNGYESNIAVIKTSIEMSDTLLNAIDEEA
tara:strand:- start:1148 stop:1546 length:399 start_codon:yes stop_codon:yes gene_type:complete